MLAVQRHLHSQLPLLRLPGFPRQHELSVAPEPIRAQNYVTVVHGKSSERTVFALEKFTIPDDKQLVIEVAEKEGGRHQSFVVENEDIVRANVIDELSIQ